MRILYLGTGHAGGVPIYTESLIQGFYDRGYSVAHLYVGGHDLRGKPYLRHFTDSKGIQYIEILNSINEYFNISYPLREVKEPKTESLVIEFVRNFNPQIIHIQNLMGLSSSIIEIAADLGYPVIVSHHNYWFICPRIELIRSDNKICEGPKDGLNCAWCCSAPLDDRYKTPSFLFKLKRGIKGTLRPYVRSSIFLSKIEKLLRPPPKGSPTIGARTNLSEAIEFFSNFKTHYSLGKITTPETALQYFLRAKYHQYLLSKKVCINLAVSSAVKSLLTSFGVSEEKILVQHIGTRAAEFIQPLPKPPLNEQVIFGFLGPLRYEKGVHLLIQAFAKLHNSKCALKVYGWITNAEYFAYLQSLAHGLKNVIFLGPYKHEDLSTILRDIHYLVVPPVWYDNAPQVVFEALASKTPVIGAEIGGIPDFVQNGVNGLLFKSGDVESLVACMNRAINDRTMFASLQEKIKPMKTIQEHIISDLEPLYSVISSAHYL